MHWSILAAFARLQNDYWGVEQVGKTKPSERAYVPAFLLFLVGQVEDTGEVSIGDTFPSTTGFVDYSSNVIAILLHH